MIVVNDIIAKLPIEAWNVGACMSWGHFRPWSVGDSGSHSPNVESLGGNHMAQRGQDMVGYGIASTRRTRITLYDFICRHSAFQMELP